MAHGGMSSGHRWRSGRTGRIDWSAGFLARLDGTLGLTDPSQRFAVDDVGHRAEAALLTEGTGRFLPTGRLHSTLLAQYGREDRGFLLPEARQGHQRLLHLGAGCRIPPHVACVGLIVLGEHHAHLPDALRHGGWKAVDGRALRTQRDEIL